MLADRRQVVDLATIDSRAKAGHAPPREAGSQILDPKGEGAALGRPDGINRAAGAVQERAFRLIHAQDQLVVIDRRVALEEFLELELQELGEPIRLLRLKVDVGVIVVIGATGATIRLTLELQAPDIPRVPGVASLTTTFVLGHPRSIRDAVQLAEVRGRRISKVVPRGTPVLSSMRPWCASTARRTMANPRPVPEDFVEK